MDNILVSVVYFTITTITISCVKEKLKPLYYSLTRHILIIVERSFIDYETLQS